MTRTSASGPGRSAVPQRVTPPLDRSGNPLPLGTYTYTVTAMDVPSEHPATSQPVSVIVVPRQRHSAPLGSAAGSPTNAVPHLTWQPPVTFAVTSWQIYPRRRRCLPTLADPATTSFDDTGVAAQGPHSYTVRAMSGGTAGDAVEPGLRRLRHGRRRRSRPLTATPNPDGSVALSWPDATDPAPGSGLSNYVVRRGGQTSPPADPDGRHRHLHRDAAGPRRVASTRRPSAARSTATRVFAIDARRQPHAPDHERPRARLASARPGDRLPRRGGPDQRAPRMECARASGQERRPRRLPHHQARRRHQAADESARRHRGLPGPRLPRQRLLRPEPEHRHEGDLRDLREDDVQQPLGADDCSRSRRTRATTRSPGCRRR